MGEGKEWRPQPSMGGGAKGACKMSTRLKQKQ